MIQLTIRDSSHTKRNSPGVEQVILGMFESPCVLLHQNKMDSALPFVPSIQDSSHTKRRFHLGQLIHTNMGQLTHSVTPLALTR